MKVLHVVATAQRRGAEMFAADLVRTLKQSDVSQRVAILRDSDRPDVQYETATTVLGSRGHHLPGIRLDRQVMGRLRELTEEWRPDVIQVHGGEPLKHVVVSRRNGTPVVYRRIGSAPLRITRGLSRIAYGHLMRRASRVIAVADALRRETVETFRVPADRVVAIPNAVDPRRLRPTRSPEATRAALGIAPDAMVVISLGALTWEKDPLAHLWVAARLVRERPETVHLFVGEGPLRPDLERAMRESRLGDRVRLLGPREDVPDLLATADLILLASRVEGLPGCLIEAGIVGLPAAAYAVAGVAEVIEDGRTGLLVSPGDLEGLAAAASRLLEDVGSRIAMGAAARLRCRSLFDIAAVVPRYLSLYQKVAR